MHKIIITTLAENLLEQFWGLDINDLQNYFNHDEDEEHEPQIFKQTAYIDLDKNKKYLTKQK